MHQYTPPRFILEVSDQKARPTASNIPMRVTIHGPTTDMTEVYDLEPDHDLLTRYFGAQPQPECQTSPFPAHVILRPDNTTELKVEHTCQMLELNFDAPNREDAPTFTTPDGRPARTTLHTVTFP